MSEAVAQSLIVIIWVAWLCGLDLAAREWRATRTRPGGPGRRLTVAGLLVAAAPLAFIVAVLLLSASGSEVRWVSSWELSEGGARSPPRSLPRAG